MDKKRAESLQHFVRRLETIGEEIGELKAAQKDVFTEAKDAGFDLKALRRILQLRRMDPQDRKELQDLVDEYAEALGVWATTPLGEAAE